MKLELTQKLEQSQILAPQMILSMDILLLATAELEQRIQKEFAENPALEVGERLGEEKKPAEAASTKAAEPDTELFDRLDKFQSQHSQYMGHDDPVRIRRDASDERLEMLQNTEGKPQGLKELLMQQIRLQTLRT